MDLTRYVEELRQQLTATAELGGDEARALAAQLTPHLEAMVRLVLLDALSAAADEITTELAPGSVSVRLRGREPEFEVVVPQASVTSPDVTEPAAPAALPADEGEVARITLRLPDQLKSRVERAASAERQSVNAWLVAAVAAALDTRRPDPRAAAATGVGQRLSGWAR